MKDFKLDDSDINFLYSKFLHNGAADLIQDIQRLEELFHRLVKEKAIVLDKYVLIGKQLQICKREIGDLSSRIGKLYRDFMTDEDLKDAQKRLPGIFGETKNE